jgi:hypothetical protein
MREPYIFEVHTHRFAGWCAATAAGASPKCRFEVQLGVSLIEATPLRAWGNGWESLPDALQFDAAHRALREQLIIESQMRRSSIVGTFTHGVAAKLINCYLKPIYACGTLPTNRQSLDKLGALHPPIDRLLLDGLARSSSRDSAVTWRKWKNKGWSTFDSDQYESVIASIRRKNIGRPLWEIEEFWAGHQ